MSNEEISHHIIGVIVKPTRMMKFGVVSPEDPPSFEEVQYMSQVVNGLLQNPPHLTQSQLVELMPMAEAPLVHLESAFLLQCMPLQEGLQQEEVAEVAEIHPLLTGLETEIEEEELVEMEMDGVVQEEVLEEAEVMAMVMAIVMAMVMVMEMVMETGEKKTEKVKLLVTEDLLDPKDLQVCRAQQVFRVYKAYKDLLDPKDCKVYLD